MKRLSFCLGVLTFFGIITTAAPADLANSLSGTVSDRDGIAVGQAKVKLLSSSGTPIQETLTSITGEYHFANVALGHYKLITEASGYVAAQDQLTIVTGAGVHFDPHLTAQQNEIVLHVQAKRRWIQKTSAVSSNETSKEQIQQMPQGGEISLPKLLASTTPGVVQGAFGQTFIRGNHANIQYQIDGVQLPDSPSNTFGQAFSPRNIDRMEVITGGVGAEYGERLSAVVNIVTKSGPEKPGGEAELNYGSYNTFSPHLMYGGSNGSGSFHYFVSANYNQTDRGLDTPQPSSTTDQIQGGTEAVHDKSYGNNEFAKLDWFIGNQDKVSLMLFNAETFYQIPNYPAIFHMSDDFFQPGFRDQFGNGGNPKATTFNYVPFNTNDTQTEANAYAQLIWKHTFNEHTFLQVAPYYKFSSLKVTNDPTNDLASQAITGSSPSSFAEDKKVNNVGLKVDLSHRLNEEHALKAGLQAQQSRSTGMISVQTDINSSAVTDSSPDTGYFESLYVQDDYAFAKSWVLNAGLRFDSTQFRFSDQNVSDGMLQPRIGLNYSVSDTTKLHAFYGKLFQPAPVENLRDTFVNTGAGQLTPYDIKAEKDDYYELGVAQQLGDNQVANLNLYYKDATNMIDDSQLLNTSIAQPFNFAKGYAYGIEFSLKGRLNGAWSDFFNYSYDIAKGKGVSGGM